MACENCRIQALRSLWRVVTRAGVSSSPKTPRSLVPALTLNPPASATRWLSSLPARKILGFGGSLTDSYRVLADTERVYKACARAADYSISPEDRKRGKVRQMEDGEELGQPVEPCNVWHNTFQLSPSFNTWSHVTMLHLYLLNARVRCFERDLFGSWRQQLLDHFFFECEKKMHVDHGIHSSALRQRYLKDIFVQWRGLLLAYDEGLVKGDAILASALWRNLFKGGPDTDPRSLAAVVGWMRATLAALEATPDRALVERTPALLARPVYAFWTQLEETLRQSLSPDVDEEKGLERGPGQTQGEQPPS